MQIFKLNSFAFRANNNNNNSIIVFYHFLFYEYLQSTRRHKKLLNKGYKTSSSAATTTATSNKGTDVEEGKGNSEASDTSKKPRTVHIDVYCTGTELEESDGSESSSSSGSNGGGFTASSPQTVFESGKYRVTHQRASNEEMPYHLRKSGSSKSNRNIPNSIASIPESDVDDTTSTAYPSQMSSYSAIKDMDSSFSSVPQSWSTISMSSNMHDYDSVNTSWKDTYSDIGSLMQSRSSIGQTESVASVPRRFLQKKESIDEYPELLQEHAEAASQTSSKSNVQTSSKGSLYPSDSFEYANSDDKVRIKRMEEMWSDKPKLLPLDEKHALQHQKLKDYLTKRNKLKKDVSRESDSDDSDISEKAWIISLTNKDKPKSVQIVKDEDVGGGGGGGSLSDTSPASRSPSILAIKQRLNFDPTLRAPFMIVPGKFTDQRKIAKKFGQIVNVFKKPGHHVGPAKNPDCMCDHCRSYFQRHGYRNRARSVGDQPLHTTTSSQPQSSRRNQTFFMENITKDGIMYTDF